MNKDLVSNDNHGHFTTTTRIIADMLKDGKNKKRDDGIHRDIIKTLKTQIFNYDSIILHSCGDTNTKYQCNLTGATFEESSYSFGRNRKAKMWIMNEEGYHLFVTHITKYKNAQKINLAFIVAFKKLKEYYQNTKDIPHRIDSLQKEIDNKNFGEISDANQTHGRVKEVRGYWRSDKNDDFSVLMGDYKRLQNKIADLFDDTNPDELKKQITEIGRVLSSIEKTPHQLKAFNKTVKLLSNPTK